MAGCRSPRVSTPAGEVLYIVATQKAPKPDTLLKFFPQLRVVPPKPLILYLQEPPKRLHAIFDTTPDNVAGAHQYRRPSQHLGSALALRTPKTRLMASISSPKKPQTKGRGIDRLVFMFCSPFPIQVEEAFRWLVSDCKPASSLARRPSARAMSDWDDPAGRRTFPALCTF